MVALIVFFCILLLVVLITWVKLNAFLSFLIVSIISGLLLGIPLEKVTASIQHGIGDTLGSLVIVIILGAMLGKLVAESGAAQKIADVLMRIFGEKYVKWALMVTGFIVGIPLFYNVGFVLMIPLIFSIVYRYKLPAVYTGLPMLAALSVTHGFLPPHPSPTALVLTLKANMGLTLLYGLIIAIPAIIIAGPLFANTLKNMRVEPLKIFQPAKIEANALPGTANSFLTSLLPVLLLIAATILQFAYTSTTGFRSFIIFAGDPSIVMLISLLVATYSLGILMKRPMKAIMNIYGDAVKDVSMIVLIIAGAGALKQVFADSGVSAAISTQLGSLPLHPLLLGWLIAAVIRVCIGSATIAGLTTAGIILPLMSQASVNPSLMVLSVGAGSLMFSHVNDSGFWMFKEYFNLSIKQTLRSWSLMETIVSIVGLIGVMLLNLFV
ncbi:MAG: gluconate transporter [Chitinophagaceae bacterium]|nr:gluconate transporter [Chitinophagaceae bacterium]